MKILFFLYFLLIITIYASTTPYSVVNRTNHGICFGGRWKLVILDDIKDPIHVRSKDDDLGNHTLAFNAIKKWIFCTSCRTRFKGKFSWRSKAASFIVFEDETKSKCKNPPDTRFTCKWVVKEDGFYLGTAPSVKPVKYHDWS